MAKENAKQYEVTGGWHDAGDYGRYTTAAATALAHMIYAQQLFPESFTENLNIPESNDAMPDVLSECLYELRWLLKMQMEDGSVCHKLTSMRHANFVMPCEDKRQMILFPASTMAAADFAAVMALASRVYRTWEPAFAAEAEDAAVRAWDWLMQHPQFIGFENPAGCNTGGYEDTSDLDERLWAAAELYVTTGNAAYLDKLEDYLKTNENPTDMGWVDVSGLAGLSCLFGAKKKEAKETQRFQVCQQKFRQAFLNEADKICDIADGSGYFVALTKEEYGWGSNMVVLNRAMILAVAHLLTGEAIHSPMITKLLVYMICNKNHIVTLEQLTEALWTDEESENPYGALKNMMYRLRGTLRKVWPVKRGSCLLYEGCHGTDEKPGAPQTAKEKYRFSVI